MNNENLYVRAIHHSDPVDQLRAWVAFLEDELESSWDRLSDFENDDGSIPDENVEGWSYEKGRLDLLRLVHGMAFQALVSRQDRAESVYEGDEP